MKTPNLFLSFFQEGDRRMMKKEIVMFYNQNSQLHSIDMTQDQSNPLKCTLSLYCPGLVLNGFHICSKNPKKRLRI